MPVPAEQVLLVDRDGQPIQVDFLIARFQKEEPHRMLADDEIGLVVYVGDLDIYRLSPTSDGEILAERVTEISRARFSTEIMRKQIGAIVISVTADTVFVIRDGDGYKKVRAENLKPNMILATGEKVYR